uniref:Uncharacterized protein n=1 Tax=Panagrolaimus davidi TaxID=227884 RepID=A0A914Q7S9_9BILA
MATPNMDELAWSFEEEFENEACKACPFLTRCIRASRYRTPVWCSHYSRKFADGFLEPEVGGRTELITLSLYIAIAVIILFGLYAIRGILSKIHLALIQLGRLQNRIIPVPPFPQHGPESAYATVAENFETVSLTSYDPAKPSTSKPKPKPRQNPASNKMQVDSQSIV